MECKEVPERPNDRVYFLQGASRSVPTACRGDLATPPSLTTKEGNMKTTLVLSIALTMLLAVAATADAQQAATKLDEGQAGTAAPICPFYGMGLGPRDGTGRGPGYGMGAGPRDGTGRGPGCGMGMGPRDGRGRGAGLGMGAGPRDGTGRGPGYGMARGPGFKSGAGWGAAQGRPGKGFTDQDADGVCDRFQTVRP
jgi:hypothetical protein